MKFISSIQGTYAYQYSVDEASPNAGVLSRDVVAFIGETFKFSVTPEVPPGLLVEPILLFQTGEVIVNKKKFPINSLIYTLNGAAITAKDTDTAEIIASHLIAAMDDKFGFKIATSIRSKYYSSIITVEFDPALEKQMSALGKIKAILEREIPRPTIPFDFKRLAFGSAEKHALLVQNPIEGMGAADFVIERRVGEPHSANRYFSGAPLTTSEHKRVLNLVEQAMRD